MPEDLKQRLEQFLIARNQPNKIAAITPDASTREYFRVSWNELPAIACVYPFNDLCHGQFAACLDVTNVFLSAGLPVAHIYAADEAKQITVQEDFGDRILRDVLLKSNAAEREDLINEAIILIAKIQAATPQAFELNSIASRLKFDEEKLLWELNFFKTHYFETYRQTKLSAADENRLNLEFTELARELECRAKVLCHRDFHAANLMIDGNEKLRIIDHQDARIGAASYDLVSLLLDRVLEMPDAQWLTEKKRFFLNERSKLQLETINPESFDEEFDLMTVQRCLKAIGTFSFQSVTRGKTYFIQYIEPMLQIVRQAAIHLDKFPGLQKIISNELST